MPYIYFAESYYELTPLDTLAQRLETTECPLKELKDKNYLPDEFNRIKRSAIRDIPIFGIHADKYINLHRRMVFKLMLRMFDILKDLPESLFLNKKEEYLRQHCTEMNEGLHSLNIFYESMVQSK